MKYKTSNPYKEETLPWAEYVPDNADKLILGTFPTEKGKRDFEFFFPNKNNRFWKVLACIADISKDRLENNLEKDPVEERKRILDKLHLAITNIGNKVLRQSESSADGNLFPIEFTDIFSIINKNPKIKTIILTSSSKGNSVLSWFTNYCKINGKILKINGSNKEYPKRTKIEVDSKRLEIVVVNSTSGAAGIEEEVLIEQYGKAIKQ